MYLQAELSAVFSHIYLRVICVNNYKIGVIFTALGAVSFGVMFFFQPDVMISGLRKGLTVCGSSVIPSLFPFMVVSDFLVRSGFSSVAGRKLAPVTQTVFRLSGAAGCAIIMSLIGGFPVGAKMTAQLYENGEITQRQGRRMLLFCVNAGPAFVIGTVGTVMLSSRRAGLVLFISLTVTSLFIGVLSAFFDKKPNEKIINENKKFTENFNAGVIAESVNVSVQVILSICGWILLFSGLNAFILHLPFRAAIPWLIMLTEVTNGCLEASSRFPACVLALVLGWSGMAVHCQLLPYLDALEMKLSHFWTGRLIAGGLATAVAYLLFKLFPCEVSVFSSAAQITAAPYSVSAPAAAAMLVLSAVMLLDIKSCVNKKGVI